MFFLLYRHTDDGVFDDFPKISDHFPKISEDHTNIDEHYRTLPKISEVCIRLPKTFEEDSNMFRSYTNEFKYNLRWLPRVFTNTLPLPIERELKKHFPLSAPR